VIDLLRNVAAVFARFFAPRAVVAAENLLLRQQLLVLRRSSPRPRIRRLDRWLIATLATRLVCGPAEGEPPEARRLLASTYGRFAQGFETADLLEARRLLSEL
jgi:hypothetical protein